MDKLEWAIRNIEACDICHGKGYLYWAVGEDYDTETCECNPYELLFDEDGDIIYTNGLESVPELLTSWEAR